ncbi:MAG: undecaprenyl-phosphate glucose phosphotransferase [Candidatus Rokuibacteriota bacterium]|nr:MAG: undecaprenyl-phosphate glucose phosphotransferase [Candidatus Rokubacteria bacterium]PYO06857.1 MAG: undecaprenyl-phosphate glucose phosphotransferase [Candidatus Rokubacteria bacterium]
MLKAHSRLVENLALVGDLCLIAVCWVLAYWIRFHLMHVTDVPPFRDYALQLIPILVVWGIAFRTFDLYRPKRLGSHVSEWIDVAKASLLGALILVSIMTFVFRGYEYSRLVILLFLAESIVTVSVARAALREVLRFARRHGYNLRYAIVVGGGEPAAEVLRVLNRRRDVGIFVLGLLSDKKEVPENVRWLGGIEDVRTVLDRQQVDIVFIALPHADASRLTSVLSGIGDDPIAIHLVPDVFSLVPARGGVEEFEMIPFIHLRESRLYGWNRVLKRGFDLLFGAVGLAIVAPVMLAIGVALKLTSPGPVLYQQERMGVDGRRFKMLKFRTMRVNAEEETGPVWARPDDPRRTALGVFLRRTSLDELPQLFNVLRGEMSLVGPRPERPSFVEEFRRRVPGYMLRHKVKAGITGWAQINGWRGNTSIERRIECDLYYIERWSLGFDLKILLQTLWYGFRINRNAH